MIAAGSEESLVTMSQFGNFQVCYPAIRHKLKPVVLTRCCAQNFCRDSTLPVCNVRPPPSNNEPRTKYYIPLAVPSPELIIH